VTFLNTNDWQPQRTFPVSLDGTTQGILKWTFMPDGSEFWLAEDARNAALHDTHTFETLLPLPAGTLPLAVSPDGRHLAVSVDARRLQVWDLSEVRHQLRALGLDWVKRRPDGRKAGATSHYHSVRFSAAQRKESVKGEEPLPHLRRSGFQSETSPPVPGGEGVDDRIELNPRIAGPPAQDFALHFNNTASYVTAAHTAGLNAFPLTVIAWVKTSSTNGQQGLVNKYRARTFDGWNLFLRDGHVRAWYFRDHDRFVWDGSDGLDGGFIADGAWHHIAFTVDANGGRLYVDGAPTASHVWNGAPGAASTTQKLRLGNYSGGILSFTNESFSLDEISVWRVALSQSQIQSNLLARLTGSEEDLLVLYRCDEGSGFTVADSAPLEGTNNAVWVGTPRFVPTVPVSKSPE
jgi:hypothetical protein